MEGGNSNEGKWSRKPYKKGKQSGGNETMRGNEELIAVASSGPSHPSFFTFIMRLNEHEG